MGQALDVLIVGQGLAGTALGWQLIRRNQRIGFIDSCNDDSASRVAAGFLTPITGSRLAVTPNYGERWRTAVHFYEAIQSTTASCFYQHIPTVRLFAAGEGERFARKPETTEYVRSVTHPLAAKAFVRDHGEFEMPAAGRLDVARFLDVVGKHFASIGPVLREVFDPAADLRLTSDGSSLPRFDLFARRIVFCQGYSATPNPWFSGIVFNAAKGEILTVRVPGLTETRTINGGVWLTPVGPELYRVGATYDRSRLDCQPTTAGREELMVRLRQFLRLPFEVIEHRAAVRPIIHVRKPVLGTHPVHRQLAFFNGLGSKGALLAPHYAGMLADHLVHGTPVDPDVDVANWFGSNR